jgi:uncharacterized protein
MKVTGGATLHAPIDTVWAALNDPAVLVRAIPGCERLQATGPDSYQLTVTAGVGSITGTYTGRISLSGLQPPSALQLSAEGAGAPGTITTTVQVHLSEDGDRATTLTYDADAQVGGMIAGVGQRMLTAVAKRQAALFFTNVDQLLQIPQQPQEPQPQPAPAVPSQAQPQTGPAPAEPRRSPTEVAGVASPTPATDQRASGMTWEAPTAARQPARRWGAGPFQGRRPAPDGFRQGVLVGAAVALAGAAVGALISRRGR